MPSFHLEGSQAKPTPHLIKEEGQRRRHPDQTALGSLHYLLLFQLFETNTSHDTFVIEVIVRLLSHVPSFATPWTAALQPPLSSTVSWSLLRFVSIELVMLSNHLILCHTASPLPSIFPSSGSFTMSLPFASGGQSIGASAAVLPVNIQG